MVGGQEKRSIAIMQRMLKVRREVDRRAGFHTEKLACAGS
jgi:hypothetical protein